MSEPMNPKSTVRTPLALTDWKIGFPPTTIDDKEVVIVQGTGAGKSRFKLYFESQTGYLVRVVRYEDTPIGMVPIQNDYADYRDVGGRGLQSS